MQMLFGWALLLLLDSNRGTRREETVQANSASACCAGDRRGLEVRSRLRQLANPFSGTSMSSSEMRSCILSGHQ